jgi:putative tryptophan/tyrosine transport system substrate-binding protein
MRRREFVWLFGAAAAGCPLATRAQQPAMPVIGFLHSSTATSSARLVAPFRKALGETGYVERQNVAVEYLFADGQYERLPSLAAELVRRRLSVIVAGSPPAALAVKAATTSIPIVFIVGLDPVAAGLVASFNRPGGNATGVSLITGPLSQKRLELIREIAPKANNIAMLTNPISPDAVPEIRDAQAMAQANSLRLTMLNASTPGQLNEALAQLAQMRPDAMLVGSDPFVLLHRRDVAAHAARLSIPAIYPFREFAEAGGLISYGTNIPKAYRQAGIYAGRILKGTSPLDLPVMQPTTFELVINLKAAKALGVDVPPALHARADEVIE